jgi:mono/diheme cytochrome c family protein
MRFVSHHFRAAMAVTGLALASGAASSQGTTRGELLYTAHCMECHTSQMHWRQHKQARDWDTLKAQVRRWQGTAGLGWGEEDITEVTRYLNRTIYQFPPAEERAGAPAHQRPAVAGSRTWTRPPSTTAAGG